MSRESPAVQALLDRIPRIEEANTYRGKVTNAGHEMIGVVQTDIKLVRAAEANASSPIPAPAKIAELVEALRDTGRRAGDSLELTRIRALEARQRAAILIEEMAIKLDAAGLL